MHKDNTQEESVKKTAVADKKQTLVERAKNEDFKIKS
jgi:hypothetical protein